MNSNINLVPRSFSLIGRLAVKDDARPYLMERCWERALPDGWRFTLNGHDQPMPNRSGASVPAFSALVYYADTPAGLIDPAGGVMLAGSEDDFIAALEAALKQEPPATKE